MNLESSQCPCGSDQVYAECCGRYHLGHKLPQTAQALMRSRYSAFVLRDSEYLLQSWHASTRPEQLHMESGVCWFGLQVIACEAGLAEDSQGYVEFKAEFAGNDRLQCLHERSRFLREQERWYYVDGQVYAQPKAEKISRNAPCPCGSGRKFKRCCG